MEQYEENKLIAKVILFSGLTTLAVTVWAELIGIEAVILIAFVILSFTIRRCIWKHYHT